jgi:hypothetical protein
VILVEVRSSGCGPRALRWRRPALVPMEDLVAGLVDATYKAWPSDGVAVAIRVGAP